MKPITFDSLVKSLPTDRERLEALAALADVPYHTLLKIAKGETRNPRIRTVEKITHAMQTAKELAA
jgi:predicted transcriptional regulator